LLENANASAASINPDFMGFPFENESGGRVFRPPWVVP
jgi:hypothetical protein